MDTQGLQKVFSRIFCLLLLIPAFLVISSCSSKSPEDEQMEASSNSEFFDNADLVASNAASEESVAPQEAVAGEQTHKVEAASPQAEAEKVMVDEKPMVDEIKKPAEEASVHAPVHEPMATHQAEIGGTFKYMVVTHDWLSKIAKNIYGKEKMWKKIFHANKKIKNPNLIYPNQILIVPIINENAKMFAEQYSGTISGVESLQEMHKPHGGSHSHKGTHLKSGSSKAEQHKEGASPVKKEHQKKSSSKHKLGKATHEAPAHVAPAAAEAAAAAAAPTPAPAAAPTPTPAPAAAPTPTPAPAAASTPAPAAAPTPTP